MAWASLASAREPSHTRVFTPVTSPIICSPHAHATMIRHASLWSIIFLFLHG
uniref:Uncharacterized protein n=1 Tax=Populus trichocarpa TaxID=3694 RepID=A0A3N7FX03_POPTR